MYLKLTHKPDHRIFSTEHTTQIIVWYRDDHTRIQLQSVQALPDLKKLASLPFLIDFTLNNSTHNFQNLISSIIFFLKPGPTIPVYPIYWMICDKNKHISRDVSFWSCSEKITLYTGKQKRSFGMSIGTYFTDREFYKNIHTIDARGGLEKSHSYHCRRIAGNENAQFSKTQRRYFLSLFARTPMCMCIYIYMYHMYI